MSIAGFKASNHPQQTGRRGAIDAIDDRGTDQTFFDALSDRVGGFTLDVAAAEHNAKCDHYFQSRDDGLRQPWSGRATWCTDDTPHDWHHRLTQGQREWCHDRWDSQRVWCNPPYSDCGAWVRKAWREMGYLDIGAEVNGGPGTYPPSGTNDVPDKPQGASATANAHQIDPASAPSLIVMLLPANRVEQGWWQDLVEPFRDRPGSPLRVEFLRGRMRFDRPGWTKPTKGDRPPFGCCLLIWADFDA